MLPSPEPVTSARLEGGGELVLIVDDEARIRTLVNSVLSASGYRVLEAIDGAEALSVVTRTGRDVDVVVTDMMMPAWTAWPRSKLFTTSAPTSLLC